jgi:hypothetical protein
MRRQTRRKEHLAIYSRFQSLIRKSCIHSIPKQLNLAVLPQKDKGFEKVPRLFANHPASLYLRSDDRVLRVYTLTSVRMDVVIPVNSIIIVQYADQRDTVSPLISQTLGWSNCPDHQFCKEYSRGTCTHGDWCPRRHWCLMCHKKHPMNKEECSLFRERVKEKDYPMSYCLMWNYAGNCKDVRCKYRHQCLFCQKKDHGSADCLHTLVRLIESDGGELWNT